jgi:hypothetical protein
MGLIEETRLLSALLHFHLKTIARFTKISLNSAPNDSKAANNHGPYHESKEVRQIPAGNVKGIKRLCEEVIETQRGQYDRHHARPTSGVPSDQSDGYNKQRQADIAKSVKLNCKCQRERDCDATDRKAIT